MNQNVHISGGGKLQAMWTGKTLRDTAEYHATAGSNRLEAHLTCGQILKTQGLGSTGRNRLEI